MRNRPLLLFAALLLMLPACAPTRERRAEIPIAPATTPTTNSSADWVPLAPPTSPAAPASVTPAISVTPVAKPVEPISASAPKASRGDVSMKMGSVFKLDMPFDTAAQLKLPAKVEGDFSIDLKSRSASSPADRSAYTCDYAITLREVGGTRILGTWSGHFSGEEDGVPSEVVDRVFKRFGTGTEILRRVVAPQ